MSVICRNCGKVYLRHTNQYGKICTKCGEYIPPNRQLPIVEENERKFNELLVELRRKLEKQYANLKRNPNEH